MSRTLVYYFAFPHYRREILRELGNVTDGTVDLVSGQSTRANIAALGEGDVRGLRTTPTLRVGPFSWDRGVFRHATGSTYDAVVLGPATMSLSTWAILFVRRLRGKKTFLWGQCGRFGDRSLKRRVQEVMNRAATGLLVYGDNEADAATQLGLSRSKVSVVHNATHSNADELSADDSEQLLQRAKDAAARATELGDVRILFIGRVNGDKRLDVLIRASAKLRSRFPGLVVDIVGDGDARDRLRETFPDPWVRFHGWVYDAAELSEFFASATFVCSPYHLGLLAVDALRAGAPVLVPDNPMNGSEVEALTPFVNSLRFPPADAQGIHDAALRWFETVHQIDATTYRDARMTALATWDPRGVASAIVKSIAEGA